VTLVKICGVNDAAAFDATVDAGADFVGFVFFPRSPRYVTPAEAAALSARHAGGPCRVGLFVDPSDDRISATLAEVTLDALQLYAPAERATALRARFGVPVWRPVGVACRADLLHQAAADRLLIETKPPADAARPGGNAIAFDWSVLNGWTAPAPWLLAGGLTPANVAAAIRATGTPGVDVSSGVERSPGVKDPALIRAFVAATRAA
jgi:phosphoribosylanthranilate isomerase